MRFLRPTGANWPPESPRLQVLRARSSYSDNAVSRAPEIEWEALQIMSDLDSGAGKADPVSVDVVKFVRGAQFGR